jgi:hypothetical protein
MTILSSFTAHELPRRFVSSQHEEDDVVGMKRKITLGSVPKMRFSVRHYCDLSLLQSMDSDEFRPRAVFDGRNGESV